MCPDSNPASSVRSWIKWASFPIMTGQARPSISIFNIMNSGEPLSLHVFDFLILLRCDDLTLAFCTGSCCRTCHILAVVERWYQTKMAKRPVKQARCSHMREESEYSCLKTGWNILKQALAWIWCLDEAIPWLMMSIRSDTISL
jgi:hypothetical protein